MPTYGNRSLMILGISDSGELYIRISGAEPRSCSTYRYRCGRCGETDSRVPLALEMHYVGF